jgi:phytoene dehydrogenase-like protein
MADPLAELSLATFRASEDRYRAAGEWIKRMRLLADTLRRTSPWRQAAFLSGPYGAMLKQWFETEQARMGLVTLAAHGTLGPHVPGTAFFVLWQAMYHRYGNWHAKGGSGSLSQALRRRLEAWGGEVRTSVSVTGIRVNGRTRGVDIEDGEHVEAPFVVAAINPQTTLLRLVDAQHLNSRLLSRLRARHRSNAVQFVVHVALDRLPPWRDAPSDVWNGLLSVGASVDQVKQNFLEAEAGYAPRKPAVYVYTPSAIDSSVALPGGHTAYVACASYPARFADGISWPERAEQEAEHLLNAVEERAPSFRASIKGLAWRHAETWEREIGLLGGHPMHLDITQDQAGPLRPLPELSGYRTPIPGIYLSGAGTAPAGGVAGVPGRAAAKALLRDLRYRKVARP